jgi:hypothetical protein
MNEINVKRMFLGGLGMLIVWVLVELLVEQVFAQFIFGQTAQEMWQEVIEVSQDNAPNFWINNIIALLNCTLLIWLYASLRPMYGVGTRTALITSVFGIIMGTALFINMINLGIFPLKIALLEALFEAIEFPIAMIAGATVYEGEAIWSHAAE